MKFFNLFVFLAGSVALCLSVYTEAWVAAIFWLLFTIFWGEVFGPNSPVLPKASRGSVSKVRDAIGYVIIKFGLSVSSIRYRDVITGAVSYGLNSAARDTREGLESPEPWQDYAVKSETGVI